MQAAAPLPLPLPLPAPRASRGIVKQAGLLVALAEMAMASGTGATLLPPPGDLSEHAF